MVVSCLLGRPALQGVPAIVVCVCGKITVDVLALLAGFGSGPIVALAGLPEEGVGGVIA